MSLDTTVGGASANSYADTATADAYLANTSYSGAWTALAVAAKEAYLIRACLALETLGFDGIMTQLTQARMWPRYRVYHPSGILYSSTAIPVPIINAQCLIAGWLASVAATNADPFGTDSVSFQQRSVHAGAVGVEFRQNAPTDGQVFLQQVVIPYLQPWYVLGGRGTRLVR